MSRELASDAEITKMINDRLKEGKELDGDCRDVRVSGVQRYVELDETGCNWNVNGHNGPAGCTGVRISIVNELRAQYNLKDD